MARPTPTLENPPTLIRHGPVAWFARNHVAANLLFFLMLVVGALSVLLTKLEVFPEIEPNIVTVAVAYPGANPEEVEKGVLLRLEEAVADVEGIKKVRGIAVESQGVLTVEAHDYANMDDFYEDVKSAIDRVTSLPEQAEEPKVSKAGERVQVMTLALFGEVDRRTLRETAEQIKDDLQQTGGVSQIDISGVPDYEISIELDERTLRQYALTFEDVARAIRDSSLDLPAGQIEGAANQVLVRSTTQGYRAEDFERIVVRRDEAGATLTIADLGAVIDGFEDVDYFVEFDGKPAILLNAYRIGDEGALNVASTLDEYLARQEKLLPAGLKLVSYNDISDALKSRIALMLRNGTFGLALVVILLGLFLDMRLAFWAAGGLVMSVVASFAVLAVTDTSINMISLFAYILVLGILVDDAIVVGENIYAHREMGKDVVSAAIDGVREVALPVTVTILTTVMAFAPLLFASGTIGQILTVIPTVVISVLLLSLVEALLILPAHLSGSKTWEPALYTRIRTAAGRLLDWFAQRPYRRLLATAIYWRYVTVCAAMGLFLISIGVVRGGILPWVFFPEVEADIIAAELEMPVGTSAARTELAVRRIYAAATKLEAEFAPRRDPQAPPLIKHIQVAIGGYPFSDINRGPAGGPAIATRDPRLGEVIIELLGSEERDISAAEVADRWRQLLGELAGARSLKFKSELIMAGEPVFVELRSGDSEALGEAAEWLKHEIAQIDGARDIKDDLLSGKPEIQITGLTPLARALGMTEADVFTQVRGAFYGEEAQRIQRGRDEVKVFVRYPAEQRRSLGDIENMFVRLPDGTEAPLTQVVNYQVGEGYSAINRTARRRVVAVTADLDTAKATAEDVNALLVAEVLPRFEQAFPEVSWSMEGEQAEQADSMASLGTAMLVALVGIYGMLAIQFKSYIQPLVVMSAIPFGIVGAIGGHLVMNAMGRETPLSFLSMFGIVALTGVVVNDSLILIDLINRKRLREHAGVERWAALTHVALESGVRRFRPIFLTTVTTFFGLVPIIMETSLQAQFIIPMAVSLGFGVLFATCITLLLVPSLYMIVEDCRWLLLPLLGNVVRYNTPEAEAEARLSAAGA